MSNWYLENVTRDPRFHSRLACRDPMLLFPPFRAKVETVIAKLAAMGQTFEIIETYRSEERQLELFEAHATQIKTRGMHGFSLACDCARVIGGRICWEAGAYADFGRVAEAEGLTWGGRWTFGDNVHVQFLPVVDQSRIFNGGYYPPLEGTSMTGYAFGAKRRTTLKFALPGWAAARTLFDDKPVWVDPGERDYGAKLPADIGMMGNDAVGDCVLAAGYHAIQTLSSWSRGVEITEPDEKVLGAYSELTGYDPADPSTDQGTDPDQFFQYVIKTGLPILPSPAPRERHKFIAGFEVDFHKIADVREAIDVCGAAFIAFQVPAYIVPPNGPPLKVWDVNPQGDHTIVGGHMVLAVGFRQDGSLIIASWGARDYTMTPAFLAKYGNQVNAVVDPTWLQTTGKSPWGLTVEQIEAQMAALAAPKS